MYGPSDRTVAHQNHHHHHHRIIITLKLSLGACTAEGWLARIMDWIASPVAEILIHPPGFIGDWRW